MLTLKAELRDKKNNLSQLRSKGMMPAVYYGKKTQSTPVSISQKDFIKVWREAGESSVVAIKTPEAEVHALIHDIDIDPVTDIPRHADFYVFEAGQKITVEVPIEFVGVSPAVKDLGAVLIKVLHDIEIEAMPKDLPHSITVDISSLSEMDSHLSVKDIKFPAGVTLVTNAEDVVVSASAPQEEEVEETPMDISEIEVEKKGKEETAEEDGEEAPAEKEAQKKKEE